MSDNHEPTESQARCAEAHCRNCSGDNLQRESFIHLIEFSPTLTDPKGMDTSRGGFLVNKLCISCFKFEDESMPTLASDHFERIYRWIHIPVNDAGIAQECVKRFFGDGASQRLRDTWTQKLRPAISDSPVKVPAHAWSMEPSIQIHSVISRRSTPGFTLFLPYLNWDHFQSIENCPGEVSKPEIRHQRRTLDEFYHSGLQNTKLRNAGQIVSKWTGKRGFMPENGRTEAVEDSLVIMVDQLWICNVDESTIVSCFPTNEPLCQGSSSSGGDLDIMASAITEANLLGCHDKPVVNLLVLLIHRSINRIFDESDSRFVDMLSIYRWAAANKAARHTELLEAFSARQSGNITGNLVNEGAEELNLILEVVDILDELNILMLLLEKQADVVDDLRRQFSDIDIFHTNYGEDLMKQAVGRLQAKKAETTRLHGEVTQTHRLVLELLDLEQKAASLGEARVTTKQGQAVMLFTIVTIIFLPLSFFTSYFGQNVVEFTGDDKNPKANEVWKVGAPISVVVIVVALVIAFFIMYSWKRSKVARAVRALLRRCRQRGGPQTDIPLRSF